VKPTIVVPPGEADAERRASERHGFPLTSMQREIWFQCQLNPDSPLHRLAVMATITGPLQPARFEEALGAVVDRQAVLRTSIREIEGAPRQFVSPRVATSVHYEDLSSAGFTELDELRQRGRFRERIAALNDVGFDIGTAPLWRAALIKVAADQHWLILLFHHIIIDGYHAGELLADLARTYDSLTREPGSVLPGPAAEYVDFSVLLERTQTVPGGDTDTYWRDRLRSSPDACLPRDRVPPARRQFATDGLVRRLDAHTAERLAKLGRRCRATPYRVLVAVYAILLGRLTGARETIVGQPFSTRPKSLEGVAGLFANTLPLRFVLDGSQPFTTFARQASATIDDAAERRLFPVGDLLDRLDQSSAHPVAAFRFGVSQVARIDVTHGPIRVEQRPSVFGAAQVYDLWLGIMERPDEISLTFGYSSELFALAGIEQAADYYTHLVARVLESPDLPIGELELQPRAESFAAATAWNDTRRPYPREATIHQLFEAQAAACPNAAAVTFGAQTITYGELNARASRLAGRMLATGINLRYVPLVFHRSIEMVVAMLAVLKVGGSYVPLDLAEPPLRLKALLADLGSHLLLTHAPAAGALEAIGGFDGAILMADDDVPSDVEESAWPVVDAASAAYVNFTSGSSGRPKGVVVPHRAVVRLVRNADYATLTPADTVLQLSTYAWDAAIFEIWGALLNGARLLIVPRSMVLDFDELARTLENERVTVAYFTTSLFNQVVDAMCERLRHLRLIIVGGETASVPHFRRAAESLPQTRLLNEYGPTENTAFSTSYHAARVEPDAAAISIGRPIANSTAYVLDEALNPCPAGVRGEIWLGGDGLAIGYLDRPDLTAKAFVPSPFGIGDRLYRTGDWGRWAGDGSLEFLGRNDHQVKINGHRVELEEVESVLRQCAHVKDVAVSFDRSARTPRLVAYLVASGAPLSAIRDYAAHRLPGYARPAQYVELEALPLSNTGKADRAALSAIRVESAPGRRAETADEHVIAAVWRDVLGEDAGVHDNFFDAGGNSLLAVQIVTRLRASGFNVRLLDVIEHQTIAALAARLPELGRRDVGAAACQGPVAAVAESEIAELLTAEGGV
jgi:amino acid adenylation domain-containing protein